MTWIQEFSRFREVLSYNCLYAPSSYPASNKGGLSAEYAELHYRLTNLIANAHAAGRRSWLEAAKRELEAAKGAFDRGDVDEGKRSLYRCDEYAADAAANRKYAATFIADASGNVSTTPDHEPAKPPPKGEDPTWPRPVVDPTWKARKPNEEP